MKLEGVLRPLLGVVPGPILGLQSTIDFDGG
jgi:hypothetical protein